MKMHQHEAVRYLKSIHMNACWDAMHDIIINAFPLIVFQKSIVKRMRDDQNNNDTDI